MERYVKRRTQHVSIKATVNRRNTEGPHIMTIREMTMFHLYHSLHGSTARDPARATRSHFTLRREQRQAGIRLKHMRTLAVLGAVSLPVAALSGCGSSTTTATTSTVKTTSSLFRLLPASIQKSDTIIDYVQPTFPP